MSNVPGVFFAVISVLFALFVMGLVLNQCQHTPQQRGGVGKVIITYSPAESMGEAGGVATSNGLQPGECRVVKGQKGVNGGGGAAGASSE